MGNEKDDETPSNLDDAFAAIAGMQSVSPGPSIFEQPTIMPLPAGEEAEKQPVVYLSLTERINLEESLLKNGGSGAKNCAADSLVEFADSDECTIVHSRRILDILTFYNKENEGQFSPQLRKVKKCFDNLLGMLQREETEFEKRDTWPYEPERRIMPPREGRQGPKKSPTDTTLKIGKTTSKK